MPERTDTYRVTVCRISFETADIIVAVPSCMSSSEARDVAMDHARRFPDEVDWKEEAGPDIHCDDIVCLNAAEDGE